MDQIKALFSPPVLAALRYALTAIAPLFALAGFAFLTPDKINSIIASAQQIGTAAASIAALLGIILPIAAGIYGSLSATIKSQIGRVKDVAQDTSQPLAEDAKQALIAATIAQPSVQTIVTDKTTADAAPSESVVAADSVTITPPTK